MKFVLFFLLILQSFTGFSQKEKPKNYRKFDERTFHFGFMLGGNVSSFNTYQNVDAYNKYGLIRMETSSQPGGQLGILSTMKLGTPVVRLRLIPSLSFQERVINQYFVDPTGVKEEIHFENRINATSLDFPLMFQFRTLRLNNFAAYALIGGQYSLDLQSQQDATQNFADPFIKIKKNDFAGQVGGGIEFFAPFFKFGIELKYSRGFYNVFIQDNTKVSNPIDKLYNNTWWISLIFEG